MIRLFFEWLAPFCCGQNENNSQHNSDVSKERYALSSAWRRIQRAIRCKSDVISKPRLIQSLK
ncbi:hypothetical protein EZ809_02710 [Salmonella enterica subsp. enterica serovar Richmond]|nr:hypothetical protein [Salmonella enterica]EBD3761426.1 hypothetical protein [Salmonella enterica]EBM0614499.1 hypothetical protein [Salmonella enterica]ECG4753352.1 hypothetical protein [Salmonella enterica subsp. enterica serovar Richmond]EDR9033022.1 hypothetical protein [Salmonella enterica subsp. enterica serovar Richmond]